MKLIPKLINPEIAIVEHVCDIHFIMMSKPRKISQNISKNLQNI